MIDRDAVLSDREAGMTYRELAAKYNTSLGSITRALMTPEQRADYIAKAAIRSERHQAKAVVQGDKLAKLFKVHGEPRCEIAMELVGTKYA